VKERTTASTRISPSGSEKSNSRQVPTGMASSVQVFIAHEYLFDGSDIQK
jgi:hypothetical protein